MSANDTDTTTVAVGIDVGSSQSRVAVCSSSAAPRVVSNTLGHRSTLSMTTLEDTHYVHGEAALWLLQTEKKPTRSIRDMLLASNGDDENDATSGAAREAFLLGHVGSLASDATASSPH